MTILKFQGVARRRWNYDHRDSGDYEDQPCIGDEEVIPKIEATFKRGQQVTVAIGDERFAGDLNCWMGLCGWSEYTPADPADLRVGPHNIVGVLDRLEGQDVTMYVADEPIDLTNFDA